MAGREGQLQRREKQVLAATKTAYSLMETVPIEIPGQLSPINFRHSRVPQRLLLSSAFVETQFYYYFSFIVSFICILWLTAAVHELTRFLSFQAVCRNNAETVAFLLEHRVDPYLRDVFGNTPLDNANCYELENIVNMLEEFSADKQSRDLSVS